MTALYLNEVTWRAAGSFSSNRTNRDFRFARSFIHRVKCLARPWYIFQNVL